MIQATDDVSLDVTYYEYDYPNQSAFNYSETYARLTAYGAYLGGYYSDDLYSDQSFLYSFVGYETKLPADIGLNLRYGWVDYKDPLFIDSSGRGRDSYNEWQATLSKEYFSFNWSVSYVDSDLSKSECLSYSGFDDTCSSSLVFGVSKTF